MRRRPLWLLAAVLAPLVVLSSCGGGSAASTKYYVSLGDSYSIGYQPAPSPRATSGYTGFVAGATGLRLENFGCGGATTTSILETDGCRLPAGLPAGTDAVSYPTQSQAAAAERFIETHKGAIALVTVSIGGNDITSCASSSNPVACVVSAVATVKANVTTLATALRHATGAGVPIIGLTYPDVILGLWVFPPGHPNTTLASLSVTAFHDIINPALAQAYQRAGGTFVDITAATSGYQPLSNTVSLAPYGTIPLAVARVCELTWYCSMGNIHANSAGYKLIGQEIVKAYDKARGH